MDVTFHFLLPCPNCVKLDKAQLCWVIHPLHTLAQRQVHRNTYVWGKSHPEEHQFMFKANCLGLPVAIHSRTWKHAH